MDNKDKPRMRLWIIGACLGVCLALGDVLTGVLLSQPKEYTISISNNISSNVSCENYKLGEVVTLNAQPVTGYSFEGWHFNGEEMFSDMNTSFTLTKDLIGTYTAIFEEIDYTLTAGGNINITGNIDIANYMDNIVFSIQEPRGYSSRPYYMVNDDTTKHYISKTNGQYSFTMPAGNVWIHANLSKINYNITSNISEELYPEIQSTANYNDSVTLLLEVTEEYFVYYVKEGSTEKIEIFGEEGFYEFTMPDANISIFAELR